MPTPSPRRPRRRNLAAVAALRLALLRSVAVLPPSSVLLLPAARAMPASPHPFEEVQPDGASTPPLYVYGDEDFHYYADGDGYTVARDGGGWFVYAEKESSEASSDAADGRLADEDEDERDEDERDDGGGDDDDGSRGARRRLRGSEAESGRRRRRRHLRVGAVSPIKLGLERRLLVDPDGVEYRRRRCDGSNSVDENRRTQEGGRELLKKNGGGATFVRMPMPPDDYLNDEDGWGQGLSPPKPGTSPKDEPPPRKGTLRNLVIPLLYSDHSSRKMPSLQDVHILFNNGSPHPTICPSGSIRSLYEEYSRGQLTVQSTVINTWITVAEREGGDASRARSQALSAVESYPSFDVDQFHTVTFLHSSYPAEFGGTDCRGVPSTSRVWAHAGTIHYGGRGIRYAMGSGFWGTCGSNVARVGMLAHEVGHLLGLPDLYDRSPTRIGSGLGIFDLMAYVWGADNSQHHPAHPSAWSKVELGWVQPRRVTRGGVYSLAASASDRGEVLLIDAGYPAGERVLVENRQPVGADGKLGSRGGLAIFHIDPDAPGQTQPGWPGQGGRRRTAAAWPRNGRHYRVAMVQADRNFDLERGANVGNDWDLWREGDEFGPGRKNVFDKNGHPNSDGYRGGRVVRTGIRIYDLSVSEGGTVTFRIEGTELEPASDDNADDGGDGGDLPFDKRLFDKRDRDDDDEDRDDRGGLGQRCVDDRSYRLTLPGGRRVGCDYARNRMLTCLKRDRTGGGFFWQRCRATCRPYFLSRKKKNKRRDICASKGKV